MILRHVCAFGLKTTLTCTACIGVIQESVEDDPVELVATPNGKKLYRQTISRLIREDRFAEAEANLLAALERIPSDLSAKCRALSVTAITMTGWDEVDRMIATPVGKAGKLCTAVQIDMSNHVNSSDGSPGIEVSLYSDSAFPFSTSSKEQLLAHNEAYCPPWTGDFEEIGSPLELTGLGLLNQELERQLVRQPQTTEGKACFVIAELFRTMRFKQAVQRDLGARTWGRLIPVLVGSNETGPFLETVYLPQLGR